MYMRPFLPHTNFFDIGDTIRKIVLELELYELKVSINLDEHSIIFGVEGQKTKAFAVEYAVFFVFDFPEQGSPIVGAT